MANYYCEYCGTKRNNIPALTSGYCIRHPNGANNGRHKLYEGSEKSQYSCRLCGTSRNTIDTLTSGYCFRHPNGPNKGRHEPAL